MHAVLEVPDVSVLHSRLRVAGRAAADVAPVRGSLAAKYRLANHELVASSAWNQARPHEGIGHMV